MNFLKTKLLVSTFGKHKKNNGIKCFNYNITLTKIRFLSKLENVLC